VQPVRGLASAGTVRAAIENSSQTTTSREVCSSRAAVLGIVVALVVLCTIAAVVIWKRGGREP
jgi:hypothetical protein